MQSLPPRRLGTALFPEANCSLKYTYRLICIYYEELLSVCCGANEIQCRKNVGNMKDETIDIKREERTDARA